MEKPILILGGGNMGGAMARRWHAANIAPVHVVETDDIRRADLAAHGIVPHPTFASAPTHARVLVLAIKPQQFSAIAAQLKSFASSDTLVLSIMAGIPLAALQQISPRAVRVMPNLPALIGESMSVACAEHLSDADRIFADRLLAAVGQVAWVENEDLLHAVTAISGSGPAYIFAMMEALQHAAIALGLPADTARQLVAQTVRGAALMAGDTTEDFGTLRRNVTSPGGTTEAALTSFNKANFNEMVECAVREAERRSRELSTP